MTTTQLPSPGRRLADPAPAAPPSKPRRRPRHLREQISGWGMIAPAAVLLLAFVFLPAVLGFGLAFTNARLVSPRPVEFHRHGQLRRLFADPVFWRSLLNVFYFAVVVVPLQSGLALVLALLVNTKFTRHELLPHPLLHPRGDLHGGGVDAVAVHVPAKDGLVNELLSDRSVSASSTARTG